MIINEAIANQPHLENAIRKAGRLPEPVTAYMALGSVIDETVKQQIESVAELGGLVSFDGIQSLSLDPDIALRASGNTLLVLEAKTGLPVPNEELELLQCDTTYRVVETTKSPPDENGNFLQIITIEEVVDDVL